MAAEPETPQLSIKVTNLDIAQAAAQAKIRLENLLAARPTHEAPPPCIYRVPDYVAVVSPDAFKPQVVSLGPYHHGAPPLLPMEEHKHAAVSYFETQSDLPLESIVECVSEKLEALQASYHKLGDRWRDDAAGFLQLMVVDGCFLLEVLSFTELPVPRHPIFSYHGHLHFFPYIARDMLLLENQLPMVLLDQLCSIRHPNQSVGSLVSNFFFSKVHKELIIGKYLHILDVYREKLLIPRKQYTTADQTEYDEESQITRSATSLREAGIKFERSETDSLIDISFKAGVLRLPPILVDDRSESAFLNLMAFEKLHIGAGNEVTNYIYFVDNLVDVDRDVALLTSKKIMVNGVGNDRAAAELVNLLARGANMDQSSHLNEVQKRVNEHCNRPCNEWSAELRHNYFQNPWAIISLVAASLGFALVILQTGYDIYGYHHPGRS